MRWTRSWRWLRLLGGAAVLAAVVHRWGATPFLDAVRRVDVRLLGLAVGVAGVTTLCAARRWVVVAEGLGTGLPLRTALAACYRSQLINSTLPAGVLGDVDRGVNHGRVVGDLGRGLRGVWWERSAGQAVQALLTVAVVLAVPSPFRPSRAVVVAGLLALTLAVTMLHRASAGSSWLGTLVRAVVADVRRGLLPARTWPRVLAMSVVVVIGHCATFVIAARAAGSTAPLTTLLPLTLLVLMASGLPLNVAGWGPREGAAAWAFGVAGLGTTAGVGASAVYGVLALVASSPGAVVLVVDSLRRTRAGRLTVSPPVGLSGSGERAAPTRVRVGSSVGG
jgi:hypothetical protein